MICLSLTGQTRDEWTEQIRTNREWIDVVELRVDLLKPAERGVEELTRWWKNTKGSLPAIVTVRRTDDLGAWEGDEAQRLRLLTRLEDSIQPEYIDLELDRRGIADWDNLAATASLRGGTVIRSHHEPRQTPNDLPGLIARLAAQGNEIPKLAVTAQSATDTARLINAAREFHRLMHGRPGIWIAMGEYGLPTRVWPARTGSVVTYTSSPGAALAAPGHVSPKVLRDVYREGEATADWACFAVVGSPIAHSKSPEYHNRRFSNDRYGAPGSTRQGAIYVPVRVDDFEEFESIATALDIRGASVTVPHKRAAYEFVVEHDGSIADAAVHGRIANTVWHDGAGWHADNTDIGAVWEIVRQHFEGPISEARVLVIGAGGAARGAIAALNGRVGSISIANRTVDRARRLAEEAELAVRVDDHNSGNDTVTRGDPEAAGAPGPPDRRDQVGSFENPTGRVFSLSELRDLPIDSFDLIVQTTSVGMLHGPKGDPSEGYHFSGGELLFDVVYTPAETAFLKRGREAGCTTVNGAGMFEIQADRQYSIFSALLNASDSG